VSQLLDWRECIIVSRVESFIERLSAASSCGQSLTAYSKTTENQSESLARLLTSSCETGSQRGSLDGTRKRARRQPANFAKTLKLRSHLYPKLSPPRHDQSSLLSLVVMIPRLGVHSAQYIEEVLGSSPRVGHGNCLFAPLNSSSFSCRS